MLSTSGPSGAHLAGELAPTMKELAEEYGAKLRVVKVDVDANPRIASQMQVRAMPTLLVIKNGSVVGQLVGDQPKDKIKALITPASGASSASRLGPREETDRPVALQRLAVEQRVGVHDRPDGRPGRAAAGR